MSQVFLKQLRGNARIIPLVNLLKRELHLSLKPAKDLVEQALEDHPVSLPVSAATDVPRSIAEAAAYGADIVIAPPLPSTAPTNSRASRSDQFTPSAQSSGGPFRNRYRRINAPTSPRKKRSGKREPKRRHG